MEVVPSKWCYKKWEEAIEAGDEESASYYIKLYKLWEERGM